MFLRVLVLLFIWNKFGLLETQKHFFSNYSKVDHSNCIFQKTFSKTTNWEKLNQFKKKTSEEYHSDVQIFTVKFIQIYIFK